MTTAHNIVPAPGPAFARPSGGGGPTVMTKPWPEWAMLRAEEVREKLPPEQWGPGTTRAHAWFPTTRLAQARSSLTPPKPRTSSTAGRTCRRSEQETPPSGRGQPGTRAGAAHAATAAEPLPVTMADPVACVEAERTNSTVARLSTKRYCAGCNPYYRPLCRGRICRETGEKRRVQPAGCCNITSTSRRRHCAKCCVGAAANLSAQVMPPTTIAAGTAARRTLGNERRARIRGLHCEGLDNRAIAHGLGVSVRTVQRALKAANDLATDRT